MSWSFTRNALYELVWSEPMQSLARRFSLSDRGLAKIGAAANIPVPTRGYWARKQAGKLVTKPALPLRAMGQPDLVWVGRDDYDRAPDDSDILNSPPSREDVSKTRSPPTVHRLSQPDAIIRPGLELAVRTRR